MENVKMKEQTTKKGNPPHDFHYNILPYPFKREMENMKERVLHLLQELERNRNQLVVYEIECSGGFGDYVTVVYVDQRARKQWIFLFDDVGPEIKVFRFWSIKNEPIKYSPGNDTTDVEATIIKLITEWELMLFAKARAEQLNGETLDIDYIAEIKRRTARVRQQTELETEIAAATYEPPTISGMVEDTLTEEERREQQIQETALRTGKDPASLKNLVQFRDKKTS